MHLLDIWMYCDASSVCCSITFLFFFFFSSVCLLCVIALCVCVCLCFFLCSMGPVAWIKQHEWITLLKICEKELSYFDKTVNARKSCCKRIGPHFNSNCCKIVTSQSIELSCCDTIKKAYTLQSLGHSRARVVTPNSLYIVILMLYSIK